MMISSQILSIPPYISSPWKNISSLYALPEGDDRFKLCVILNNGTQVFVPSLDKATIDSIYEAHARYGASSIPTSSKPFSIPVLNSGDLFHSSMQHNPELANSPEIPKEVLQKITSIAKVLGLEDSSQLPKAEPHCNCPFCQIARALNGMEETKTEEIVSDQDLQFRNWDIKQTADHLYVVTNPLDPNEHYNVFLGDPLGCTCGQKNCEHIRAVLNS